MTTIVQIIGVKIACEDGLKDAWRETATWAEKQLKTKFGESVKLQYYDLFDPACPSIPPDSQLPYVLVNGEVLSIGGKISLPMIRSRNEIIHAHDSKNLNGRYRSSHGSSLLKR